MRFPDAENSKAYTDSHVQLYNLIIDGLNKSTIEKLAKFLKISLSCPSKTLKSFREILGNEEALVREIYNPIRKCCYEKRQKIHGVKDIKSVPAFENFRKDLVCVSKALAELKRWLEDIFNVDAESCRSRVEMKKLFPELEFPEYLRLSCLDIKKAKGKRIKNIEFGKQKSAEGRHETEAMIIHFEDGTSLAILIGSNAHNLTYDYEGLKESEFKTDFIFFWAPSIKKKN